MKSHCLKFISVATMYTQLRETQELKNKYGRVTLQAKSYLL